MPKRQRFPNKDLMYKIQVLLPSTAEVLCSELSLSETHVRKYLTHMHKEHMIYVCGYSDRVNGRITSIPARIWAVGSEPDVVFESKDQIRHKESREEFYERMNKLQEAREKAFALLQKQRQESDFFDQDDFDSPLRRAKLARLAQKMVNKALAKQNTPFGPLFDLSSREDQNEEALA